MDDYVEITSFNHHPFYEQFELEIPDNWLHEKVYNVPLNDMMEIIDYAINNGYTVAWGSDVSEKGFKWSKGIAVVPDETLPDLTGTEKERWEKLTEAEKQKQIYSLDAPVKEKVITQELRQIALIIILLLMIMVCTLLALLKIKMEIFIIRLKIAGMLWGHMMDISLLLNLL